MTRFFQSALTPTVWRLVYVGVNLGGDHAHAYRRYTYVVLPRRGGSR